MRGRRRRSALRYPGLQPRPRRAPPRGRTDGRAGGEDAGKRGGTSDGGPSHIPPGQPPRSKRSKQEQVTRRGRRSERSGAGAPGPRIDGPRRGGRRAQVRCRGASRARGVGSSAARSPAAAALASGVWLAGLGVWGAGVRASRARGQRADPSPGAPGLRVPRLLCTFCSSSTFIFLLMSPSMGPRVTVPGSPPRHSFPGGWGLGERGGGDLGVRRALARPGAGWAVGTPGRREGDPSPDPF